MYCDKCGAKISDDSVFCDVCGEEVTPTPEGSDRGGSKQGGSKQTSGRGKTSIKEGPSAASKAAKIIPIVAVVVIIGLLAGLRQNSKNKAAKEVNETNAPVETAQTQEQGEIDQPVVSEPSQIGNGEIPKDTGAKQADSNNKKQDIADKQKTGVTPDDLSSGIKEEMIKKADLLMEDYVVIWNSNDNLYATAGDPNYLGMCILNERDGGKYHAMLVYSVDWEASVEGVTYDGQMFNGTTVYYPVIFKKIHESVDGGEIYEDVEDDWRFAYQLAQNGASKGEIKGYRSLTTLLTSIVRRDNKYIPVYEEGLLDAISDAGEAVPQVLNMEEDPIKISSPQDLTDDIKSRMRAQADKIVNDYVTLFSDNDNNLATGSNIQYLGLVVYRNDQSDDSKVMMVYSVDWEAKEDGVTADDDYFLRATVYYPVVFEKVRMYSDGVEDYDNVDTYWDFAYQLAQNWAAKGEIKGYRSMSELITKKIRVLNGYDTREPDDELKKVWE